MLFSCPNEFWTLKWSLIEWGIFPLTAVCLGCRKCKFETPLSKKRGISLSSSLHPPTMVPSVPPSSVHALNWAACPAQPPQDTHAHGSRQSWVMLTEPQHAQSQCPGLWLGSVCYHFLQINKCIWGWCMFCTGQNRGSSAGYIEIGIVWLWHCGMYLSLRCTHGGSHTKKPLNFIWKDFFIW